LNASWLKSVTVNSVSAAGRYVCTNRRVRIVPLVLSTSRGTGQGESGSVTESPTTAKLVPNRKADARLTCV